MGKGKPAILFDVDNRFLPPDRGVYKQGALKVIDGNVPGGLGDPPVVVALGSCGSVKGRFPSPPLVPYLAFPSHLCKPVGDVVEVVL